MSTKLNKSLIAGLILSIICISFSLKAEGTPGTFLIYADNQDNSDNAAYRVIFPSNIVEPFPIYNWEMDAFKTTDGRHAIANRAKAYLNALPDGKRNIFLWCYNHNPNMYTEFLSGTGAAGVAALAAMWDDFFSYYKSIGGKVDAISHDFEGPYDEWSLPYPLTPAMKIRNSTYVPARTHYPEVKFAGYDNYIVTWSKYPVRNVYGDCPAVTDSIHGNLQSPALYGWCKNNLPTYLTYPITPFKIFLHDIDLMRACMFSRPNIKIRPYIAWPTWNWKKEIDGIGTLAAGPDVATQTAYYREEIMHLCLNNPDQFLLFVVMPGTYYANLGQLDQTMSQNDVVLMSMLLKEADEVLGYADRQTLQTSVLLTSSIQNAGQSAGFYNTQKYLLSGMYANRRNVWRITPDTTVVGKAAFKTSDNPLTFKVGTTTIVFPTGSAVLVPVKEYTQIGYWVTSPYNTSPSINGTPVPLKAVDTTIYPVGVKPEQSNAKYQSSLIGQPQPNAFGGISLVCNLPKSSQVKLDVLNSEGKMVCSVVNGSFSAGNHILVWNKTSNAQQKVIAGVYFAQVKVNDVDMVRKIIITK